MDANKIIDINNVNFPAEAKAAFEWNTKLVDSAYQPMVQAEVRSDGSVSAFITTDAKAILFFDDCKRNGKNGRIIDDEVTLNVFGDHVLVQAKAYIYIDDVLKGTAVAGQSFQIGNVVEMDQCIQMASGIARSRALTNAGYGVVSGVTLPATNGSDSNWTVPDPFLPAGTPVSGNPGSVTPPATNPAPVAHAGPAGQQAPMPGTQPNDPVVWAKNVFWKQKKATMGALLATNPRDITWAAENKYVDGDIKSAAQILYPEACRMLGVAPKNLK